MSQLRARNRILVTAAIACATVVGCAAPASMPSLAFFAKKQPVDAAAPAVAAPADANAAAPLPAPVAAAPLPKLERRVLGERPAKPLPVQTLPVLPREQYEGAAHSPALPYGVIGPWAPPGIKGPYPADEYLHDGGDLQEPVSVSPEWRVEGLNIEDTVAHYDTPDGRTLVEQSNCAYLYAPRFSSVRSVVALVSNDFVDAPSKTVKPVRVARFDERESARTNVEQQQPIGAAQHLRIGQYERRQKNEIYSLALLPSGNKLSFAPFEDFSVIRNGAMQSAEKARLAEAVDAALVWTKDDGVRVNIGRERAAQTVGTQRAQVLFTVKEPENGRLRICKIASTPAAQPGEFVEFTLRYDNVGDQVLGNIVILDSLTSRLEYVGESATSSRKAHFSVNPNAAESLELRWEIDEPLQPGDGGVVRFRCRVR